MIQILHTNLHGHYPPLFKCNFGGFQCSSFKKKRIVSKQQKSDNNMIINWIHIFYIDFQTTLKMKFPSEHVNFQTKSSLNCEPFLGKIMTELCEKLTFLFKWPKTCKYVQFQAKVVVNFELRGFLRKIT